MEATRAGVLIGDRYELGPLLRRGGMADVHAGLDRRLGRDVAIKLLRRDMAERDDVRLRFESEARAAARLSHPNAVSVFDTGEHEGQPYIVMERLPGRTLADVIAEGPVSVTWLVPVATGVLSALGAAHAVGIVHRDVKPGNILLAADGTAKIADFGIAKSAEMVSGATAGTVDLTLTGQLIGTPAYLAPERLAGAPATFLSDLYSMGLVLYEALAGFKPFTGDSFIAVAQAVQNGGHPPLSSVRPDVDQTVAAAVERALDRDPSRRFASAEEMAAALTGDRVAAPAVAASGDETTILAADSADGLGGETLVGPAMPLPLSAPARRAPLRFVWAIGLAVLLALISLLALTRSPSPKPVSTTPSTAATTVAPTTTPTTAPPTTVVQPATRTRTTPAPPARHRKGGGHKG